MEIVNNLVKSNGGFFKSAAKKAAILSTSLMFGWTIPALALDGGTLRVNTYNGWKAFEVISQNDDPAGDGYSHSMPSTFDGAGAWMVDPSTLRIQVNHETSDASISEVDLDFVNLQNAILNVINSGTTGGVSFVLSARQAYDRWSDNGGASWTNTSSASNTSFYRFCSGQAFAPDTYGPDRGFVDQVYMTGEEGSGNRLFVLDSVNRDLYQLSGTIGSAPGGIGGMSFDSWENAALLDTGETQHVALLLSPDGGSSSLKLYIGEKGKDANGNASSSFLARNGLAYGSWYYLKGSLPGSVGSTNNGNFDTSSSGALAATKMEDVDTSPSNPNQAVLGNQNYGVFTLNFNLVFGSSFNVGSSSFSITKISNVSGGSNSLNGSDNVDWTAATTLAGNTYAEGLIFVNEDSSEGEVWVMNTDGSNKVLVGSTTVGAESTGIFDISEFVGYAPGSVLISNNQGSPTSMTVLINPDATSTNSTCGDSVCNVGENAQSCPQDCPDVCGDSFCTGFEGTTNCPADCGSQCGDGVCNGNEDAMNCSADCATPDTSVPTVPTDLSFSNVGTNSLQLNWSASTDNVGVTGYLIRRDGTQVGNVSGASFGDSGLSSNTAYSYTVEAYDAAGNRSGESTSAATNTASEPPVFDLSSMDPNTVPIANATVSVSFYGSGFEMGASVDFTNGSGPAPTLSNIVVVDSNTITAMLTTSTKGPKRNRVWDVVITNPNGDLVVLAGGLTMTY